MVDTFLGKSVAEKANKSIGMKVKDLYDFMSSTYPGEAHLKKTEK